MVPRAASGRWGSVPQEQLARAGVVSLLREGVLCGGVKVTQPPLQRGGLVECAAAPEREAGIGNTSAGCSDPCRGLRALREERVILQRSRERVAPMTLGLDPEQRLRRP